MDYVTRQFINLTKKFRKETPKLATSIEKSLGQNTKAISAATERNQQQHEVYQEWLRNFGAHNREAEADRNRRDDRSYRLQNSIRWATWCAFLAATIYAAISALLLIEASKATKAAQEQAQYAGKSISQEHDQFIDSIRPVVWITNLGHPEFFQIPGTNPVTGQLLWTYHFTAIGDHLAYNLSTVSRTYRIGRNGVWKKSFDDFGKSSNLISIPVAPHNDFFGTAVSAPGIPIDRFTKLKDTDEGISMKVVWKFEDSYGNTYYTGVCLTQLKVGSIQYCGASYMSSKKGKE